MLSQAFFVYCILGGTAIAFMAAVILVRILRHGRPGPMEKADCIVVFGAAVWPGGPSLALRTRVDRAAEIYKQGLAPKILCSGGWSGGRSEANVMRAMLLESGVPAPAVIPDDGGVTTRKAVHSAKRFENGAWRRVIVVSSTYHILRILQEARRQGIKAIACPAAGSGPFNLRRRLFYVRQYQREIMAVPAYAVGWRINRLLQSRWGRVVRGPIQGVYFRMKSLAGEADAVTDASNMISGKIKAGRVDYRDTETILTPAAGLSSPVKGALGDRFGLRHRRLHSGIDIRSSYGTRVCAAAGGEVILAGRLGPFGDLVVVDHMGGLATVYAHLSGFIVHEGDKVKEGQHLGYVGDTGKSFGPHLHFEVRAHGSPVDPLVYITCT